MKFNEAYFVTEELPAPYRQVCLLHRPRFEMGMHRHAFWQLILVTEGQLTVRTDTGEYVLTAGTVHILPPNMAHALYSSGYTQLGIDLYPDVHVRELIPQLMRCFTSQTVLQVPRAVALCEEIAARQQTGTALAFAQMISLLDMLVFYCVEAAEQPRRQQFEIQLEAYLDARLSDALRLNDVAAQFYLSIPQLERLCRAAFGCGVMALLQQRRVRRAQMLLLGTELSVAEIGRLTGYAEAAHFSNFFRRAVGVSPRAFRNQSNQYA